MGAKSGAPDAKPRQTGSTIVEPVGVDSPKEPSRPTARIRRGVLSRARRKLREVGLAYAIQLAFRRMTPARFFRSARYALLTLEPKLAHTGIDFGEGQRWARPDDGALLRAFGHSQETIDERLADGTYGESMQLQNIAWQVQARKRREIQAERDQQRDRATRRAVSAAWISAAAAIVSASAHVVRAVLATGP